MPFSEYLTWLLPESHQAAVAWILLTTIGGTHIAKTVAKAIFPKIKRFNEARIAVVSMVVAFLACYQLWPAASDMPWWLAALGAGPAANQIYRIGIKPVKEWVKFKVYGIKPLQKRRNND